MDPIPSLGNPNPIPTSHSHLTSSSLPPQQPPLCPLRHLPLLAYSGPSSHSPELPDPLLAHRDPPGLEEREFPGSEIPTHLHVPVVAAQGLIRQDLIDASLLSALQPWGQQGTVRDSMGLCDSEGQRGTERDSKGQQSGH